MRRSLHLLGLTLALALLATSSFGQTGKLKIKVSPSQAYVFVDGKAVNHGSRTIALSPGKHSVAVVNYGYKISTQDVNIDAGKSTDLNVTLEPYGDKVPGPWGRVYIGGSGGDTRAAVLSDGTTPGYFVGHVDEFNNDFWIWKQELLLPPGKHHLTITRDGKTLWEGDVNVVAGKKVSINFPKNQQTEADWSKRQADLEKHAPLPRFKAGIASATIVVAPTKASFSNSTANIDCGQTANLAWTSSDAVDTSIDNGVGTVASSGQQGVSPHQTTTYTMTAAGPGGVVTNAETVNVNTAVQASIDANPSDVKYHQIGDKVVSQDSTTLTWKTSNADNVQLDGSKVDTNGSQTVKVAPKDTTPVAEGGEARTVDEQVPYTLTATNVCGGSSTQTANVHVTGSVEPIPAVLLQSVFYPTNYPDKQHPQVGLVRSQQLVLATLASGFKKYLEYDPDAKLSIDAYADVRGGKEFNQDLSERRVERVKQYLVDQGVPADKIQTAAYGKERPLEKSTVKDLEATNPNKAPKGREKNFTGNWYAYNRRVDVVLLPADKKSSQFFPHNADDSELIWQIPMPSLKKVEKDQ
ncbi:MAG TPA: OmpA family protein [Candidatus Acidoferrum sp.]|nr:OmpA family protein [Candidatus Acidoferrum sp.]